MRSQSFSPIPVWRVLGTSVTGTSHHKMKRDCEDAHGYRQLHNGTLLMVAADGAGSASRSAEGAACAIEVALDTAESLLTQYGDPENETQWRTFLTTIVKSVREALEKLVVPEITLANVEANQPSQPEPIQYIQAPEASTDLDEPIPPEKVRPLHYLLSNVQNIVQAAIGKLNAGGTKAPTNRTQSATTEMQSGIDVAEPELTEIQQQTTQAQLETNRTQSGTSEAPSGTTVRVTHEALRQYATTFLFATVTSQWIAMIQIGDGAAVIQNADETLQCLTWPDHGEYVNESSFITDSNYLNTVQYHIIPQHKSLGVALFTDGIERIALDFTAKVAYQPFFEPLFKYVASADATQADLKAFLESDRICERTDDDKTLVMAVLV